MIEEIHTQEELIGSYEVMRELRTDLSLEGYIELLGEMKESDYRLFALKVDGEIVSLAGIEKRVNFYNKHHFYIHDLVTSSDHRSKGYGKQLLEYVHSIAAAAGAEYVALESGLTRQDAHRFYEEKLDYDKWCYSFRKRL